MKEREGQKEGYNVSITTSEMNMNKKTHQMNDHEEIERQERIRDDEGRDD